jgi:hypothetical protein
MKVRNYPLPACQSELPIIFCLDEQVLGIRLDVCKCQRVTSVRVVHVIIPLATRNLKIFVIGESPPTCVIPCRLPPTLGNCDTPET